jgi:hypothetical protein
MMWGWHVLVCRQRLRLAAGVIGVECVYELCAREHVLQHVTGRDAVVHASQRRLSLQPITGAASAGVDVQVSRRDEAEG